jgi:hypothetical protein
MKKFLLAESEKERILGMHYNAMGKTLVNEASTPKAWLKYPKQQYMSVQPQLKNVKPGAVVRPLKPALATTSNVEFAFIIPTTTTFTGVDNFLVGPVFRVDKSKLDKAKLADTKYLSGVIANKDKLGLIPTEIGLTQDGTVIFPNGDTRLRIIGDEGSRLSNAAIASFQ